MDEEVKREIKKGFFRLFMFIFSIGLILIAYYASVIMATAEHEEVHKTIYRSYGISSHIEYNYWFPFNDLEYTGRTIPDNWTLVSIKCNETCEQQHNFNETIGYTYMSFLDALVLFALVFFTIWTGRNLWQDHNTEIKQYIKIEKKYYQK